MPRLDTGLWGERGMKDGVLRRNLAAVEEGREHCDEGLGQRSSRDKVKWKRPRSGGIGKGDNL
jgi:hypothetical protein